MPACLFRGKITVWLIGVGTLHICHLLKGQAKNLNPTSICMNYGSGLIAWILFNITYKSLHLYQGFK